MYIEVELRNKTSVPVFYHRIKYRDVSALITRTQMSTDILFCDKTRIPMFYFDSKTERSIMPLECAVLVF